jgi:hypothetical protein
MAAVATEQLEIDQELIKVTTPKDLLQKQFSRIMKLIGLQTSIYNSMIVKMPSVLHARDYVAAIKKLMARFEHTTEFYESFLLMNLNFYKDVGEDRLLSDLLKENAKELAKFSHMMTQQDFIGVSPPDCSVYANADSLVVKGESKNMPGIVVLTEDAADKHKRDVQADGISAYRMKEIFKEYIHMKELQQILKITGNSAIAMVGGGERKRNPNSYESIMSDIKRLSTLTEFSMRYNKPLSKRVLLTMPVVKQQNAPAPVPAPLPAPAPAPAPISLPAAPAPASSCDNSDVLQELARVKEDLNGLQTVFKTGMETMLKSHKDTHATRQEGIITQLTKIFDDKLNDFLANHEKTHKDHSDNIIKKLSVELSTIILNRNSEIFNQFKEIKSELLNHNTHTGTNFTKIDGLLNEIRSDAQTHATKKEIDSILSKIDGLIAKGESSEEIIKLREQLETYKESDALLNARVTTLTNEVDAQSILNNAVTKSFDDEKTSHESTKKQFAEQQATNAKLLQDISTAQSSLQKEKDEHASVQQDLKKTAAQLSAAKAKSDELSTRHESLQANSSASATEVAQLKEKLNTSLSKEETYKQKINDLLNDYNELTKNVNTKVTELYNAALFDMTSLTTIEEQAKKSIDALRGNKK